MLSLLVEYLSSSWEHLVEFLLPGLFVVVFYTIIFIMFKVNIGFFELAVFFGSMAVLMSIALSLSVLIGTGLVLGALTFSYFVSRELKFWAKLLIDSMIYVFFRDVETRNSHYIPKAGPVLFVCGPHASQFVDPILIMTHTPREVRFLIAAKSVKRKFVGFMSKLTASIPITRPQDHAIKGTGTVMGSHNYVRGSGTVFTKEFSGDNNTIYVGGIPYRIQRVVSDTELYISGTLEEPLSRPAKFKIFPKIDHSVAYQLVYEAFERNEGVGIFPEGGSHDQPDLLPLKAGVAIMALGFMSKHKGKKVRIVPVGLNYFHGHRFRSRALLDFGFPIEITEEQVAKYTAGGTAKREAISALMDSVKTALSNVTATADDFETLELLWAFRRLYKPEKVVLTLEQTEQLTLRWISVHRKCKDLPEYIRLGERVREYNQMLRTFKLRDHQVTRTSMSAEEVVGHLIVRGFLFIVETVFLLPFFIFGLPVLVLCRIVSASKAKKAAKTSAVKDKGRDLVATWKILTATAVIPLAWSLYVGLAAFIFGWQTGLVLFVVLPLTMLISLRVWDHYLLLLRSFIPLYMSIARKGKGVHLLKTRNKLKRDIRKLISNISDQLEYPRMFTEEDFVGEEVAYDDKEDEEDEGKRNEGKNSDSQ